MMYDDISFTCWNIVMVERSCEYRYDMENCFHKRDQNQIFLANIERLKAWLVGERSRANKEQTPENRSSAARWLLPSWED